MARLIFVAVLTLTACLGGGCKSSSEADATPTAITPEQEKAMKDHQKVVEQQERQEFRKGR